MGGIGTFPNLQAHGSALSDAIELEMSIDFANFVWDFLKFLKSFEEREQTQSVKGHFFPTVWQAFCLYIG